MLRRWTAVHMTGWTEEVYRLCLVGAIDDATNHVPCAVFWKEEDI